MKNTIIHLTCLALIIAGILALGAIIDRQSVELNHRHHAYQFDVNNDSYTVYSGGRTVGTFKWGVNPVLDSIVINDNQ